MMLTDDKDRELMGELDKYLDKIREKIKEALQERKPLEHYINNATNYGKRGFSRRDVACVEQMIINSAVISFAVRKSNSL